MTEEELRNIVIGQECVCPDGLGRVAKVTRYQAGGGGTIYVDTYFNNRLCGWDSRNVRLVRIDYQSEE